MLRPVFFSRVTLILTAIALTPFAQPALAQQSSDEHMIHVPDHPLLRPFQWRSIGPVGQGGRVDDIAVRPDDPHTYFVGFATGGLWKTTNNHPLR